MNVPTRFVLAELIEQAYQGLRGEAPLSNLYYYRGRHDALTEVDLMVANHSREIGERLDTELQKNKDLNARLANMQNELKVYQVSDRIKSENIKILEERLADKDQYIEQLRNQINLFRYCS